MKLIKLDKNKNIMPKYNITYYLNPDFIYIPTDKKNILVKQNQLIYKDDLVESNKFSSVSGVAYGIKKCNVLGKNKDTLVIQNDFRELSKRNKGRKRNITIPSLLKLLEEAKEYKLLNKFKSNMTYESIIVSAINDEPYVYNKIFLLKESIIDVLELMEKLSILFKSDENLLVIKNNEEELINECLNVIGTFTQVKLTLVNDYYLLEKEEVLKEVLNKKNNTLYLDISDIITLNNVLKQELPSTTLISIAGDALEESKVMRVKKYSLLDDIVNKFFLINTNKYDVIINGLMNGFKINTIKDFVISEEVTSVNIMKKKVHKESKCIRCGKCIEVCPKKVNPLTLKNKEKCIDCGLCTYICPSYINLKKRLKEK